MKFKELELTGQESWLKRKLWSKHARKTYIAIIAGAAAGITLFYLTEGRHMNEITGSDLFNPLVLGAFFGFFVTNSPCSRGRC